MLLLLAGSLIAQDYNEPEEEPPGRVARVSFAEGDVQILRDGEEEWELVVRDLPVVEGDEIVTGTDGRFEIQFDNDTHVRVANDSVLKIASLSEEGIAVSLEAGRMNLTTRKFDPDKKFLEIDAPSTTVAILRAGRYRVDAPAKGAEVRIGVSSDGEARVYSSNAGFTLKSGRSASVFINGENAGEWEMRDYAGIDDDFDKWTFDRDDEFAKRLATANYGEYYDDGLYGAEDLNAYGSWVHNASYGYVWQPSVFSLRNYSDWSPYRYGHWRWIPAFGWTWVNDEPWGWTTYHHGRWFWSGNNWYWSPFGTNRSYGNRWRPALVYVTVVSNNVCWYPLPYNSPYYNYNSRYLFDRRRDRRNGANTSTSAPVQTPTTTTGPIAKTRRNLGGRIMPVDGVPASAVTAVSTEQFGRGRRGIGRASVPVATTVLSSSVNSDTEPNLPEFRQLNRRINGVIATQTVPPARTVTRANTGAAARLARRPLDRDLRATRFFDNRAPATGSTAEMPLTPSPAVPARIPTGAVTRSKEIKESPPVVRPRNETPGYVPRVRTPETRSETPSSAPTSASPRSNRFRPRTEPIRTTPRRSEPAPPVNSPPVRRSETPRSAPPQRTQPQPRREQPSAPPRSSGNSSSGQTRSTPPARSTPVRPAPPSERKTRPD